MLQPGQSSLANQIGVVWFSIECWVSQVINQALREYRDRQMSFEGNHGLKRQKKNELGIAENKLPFLYVFSHFSHLYHMPQCQLQSFFRHFDFLKQPYQCLHAINIDIGSTFLTGERLALAPVTFLTLQSLPSIFLVTVT